MSSGEATGIISLQNNDHEDAFTDSDARLLTTLAASLSVSLENARLFDETRRLLSEADERAAELALINSVQRGLSSNLDMQAMYELVGDKIQEIFEAQVVDIGLFDFEAGLAHYPYIRERGVRFPDNPLLLAELPLAQELIRDPQPILINDVAAWEAERGVDIPVTQGENARSILLAPLHSGGQLRGRISIQNLDRENAFSESDVRLLTTLAASLSVALENARLFDETKRLLSEADERAAELAIINSVQRGLSSNLDMQAMYDLVGDKIQEIFDAQGVDIAVYDQEAGLIRFMYAIEQGQRLHDEPIPVIGFRRHVIETREPLLINRDAARRAVEEFGQPAVLSGLPTLSALFVPLMRGGEVTGIISLQNNDH